MGGTGEENGGRVEGIHLVLGPFVMSLITDNGYRWTFLTFVIFATFIHLFVCIIYFVISLQNIR